MPQKELKTCELKVEGMHCGSCEWAVESAMSKEKGFVSAIVSHSSGKAIVKYDSSETSPEMLAKAIVEKSGYRAVASRRIPTASCRKP